MCMIKGYIVLLLIHKKCTIKTISTVFDKLFKELQIWIIWTRWRGMVVTLCSLSSPIREHFAFFQKM